MLPYLPAIQTRFPGCAGKQALKCQNGVKVRNYKITKGWGPGSISQLPSIHEDLSSPFMCHNYWSFPKKHFGLSGGIGNESKWKESNKKILGTMNSGKIIKSFSFNLGKTGRPVFSGMSQQHLKLQTDTVEIDTTLAGDRRVYYTAKQTSWSILYGPQKYSKARILYFCFQ